MSERQDSNVKLSIIIVNWNARTFLGECLTSIAAAVGSMTYEVVVVDNDSNDGSVEFLQREFSWVKLVTTGRNLGFGAGVRLGMQSSAGEYIATSNPDVRFLPQCLEKSVMFLAWNSKVGVVGPAHLGTKGQLYGGAESLPGVMSALFDFPVLGRLQRVIESRRRSVDRPTRCEWVRGACLVCARGALEAIGGFPIDTFLYGEEILVGHRMRRLGYEVWYLPHAAIVHAKEVSVQQRWNRAESYFQRRKARLTVMRVILHPLLYFVWNLATLVGLSLQYSARILQRASGADTPQRKLIRLHGEALLQQLKGGQ